jgi:catechol 2,3-dioxygenase-like lactoylglutathione lyase family enzyme
MQSPSSPRPSEFYGFDHVDCRVRSLTEVEAFYDDLMPAIGLTEKRYAYVDLEGHWHGEFDTYNAIEYYEPVHPTKPRRFFGIIENPLHRVNDTRIAFRVEYERMNELIALLRKIDAPALELSEDMQAYPGVFFEDPMGTRLELTGRAVR